MKEENKSLEEITGKKPELEIGKKCKIAGFPGDSAIGKCLEARYLGATYVLLNRKIHIFFTEKDKGKEYFLLDDNWICERGGIIDYKEISSYRYYPYTKKEIEKNNRLRQILNQLGEKI